MQHPKTYIAFFLVLLFSGCEEDAAHTDVPLVPVEFTINLTLQQYMPLLNIGGYVYDERGYKGIIVYRESSDRYIAIERACAYQPRKSCEIVAVDDSGFFLVDDCCGSTFDFQGNPTGAPADQPLLIYNTFLNGDFLTITNRL